MVYDNVVLTLGNVGVGSSWYAAASTGRFVLHAALLPLLIPYALSALRVSGAPIAKRRGFVALCALVAVAAWCYGFWQDVLKLELAAAEVFGHFRLSSTAALPPLGTIGVNLVLIALAFMLWRSARWPLLLAGALLILLANGATGGQSWGYLVGNAMEIAFMLCLYSTERFLLRRSP